MLKPYQYLFQLTLTSRYAHVLYSVLTQYITFNMVSHDIM